LHGFDSAGLHGDPALVAEPVTEPHR
jgi:hypothetical protein